MPEESNYPDGKGAGQLPSALPAGQPRVEGTARRRPVRPKSVLKKSHFANLRTIMWIMAR